jgi:hypothetical protein
MMHERLRSHIIKDARPPRAQTLRRSNLLLRGLLAGMARLQRAPGAVAWSPGRGRQRGSRWADWVTVSNEAQCRHQPIGPRLGSCKLHPLTSPPTIRHAEIDADDAAGINAS